MQDVEDDGSQDESGDEGSGNGNAPDRKVTIKAAATEPVKHPGSIKQLLGSNSEKQKGTNAAKRSTHHTERLACSLEYRVSTNQIVDRSMKPSLVDRGANGGVGGEDVRLIHYVPGKTVTIQGIDNHQMRSIRIGTVAGVVQTTLGRVMLIFNQYAYTGRGASIHSAVQMEHYGCRVDERSAVVGGTQTIVTPNGYVIPLSIVDGLARLPISPATDADLRDTTLVQEFMTSELDWDPRVLDNELSDSDLSQASLPIERNVGPDNIFDETGTLRGYYIEVDEIESLAGPDGEYSVRDVIAFMQEHDVTISDTDFSRAYLQDDDSVALTEADSSSDSSSDVFSVSSAHKYLACRALLTHDIPPFVVIDTPHNPPDDDDSLDVLAIRSYQTFIKGLPESERQAAAQFAHSILALPTLSRKDPDFEALRPLLAYQPSNIVKKTFENTTQLARLSEGTVLKKHYKSPNPALNVERRKEGVATDTIFADVRALGRNVTEAQVFVGVDTLVTDIFPLKSQTQFPKVLMDAIILRGVPSLLISDGARAENSEKVKEILRTLVFPQWNSERGHQHQNKAERRIQDLKRVANTVLDRSGAPDDLWFECMLYVCDVFNHSFNEGINDVPLYLLDGVTPDISAFLLFRFYERVLYRVEDNSFPSESREALGYFVGVSRNVGNAMTFRILTSDTRRIIARSGVRSADNPIAPNLRVTPLSLADLLLDDSSLRGEVSSSPPGAPTGPVKSVIKTRSQVVAPSGDDGADTAKQLVTPVIDPSTLLGRTFLMDDPRGTDQRFRAKIIAVDRHPDHIRFRCSVNNGEYEETMNYQRLMDYIQQDTTTPTEWKFHRILGHQGPLVKGDAMFKGSSYNVKVEWGDGAITWEPLTEFAKDAFVECAIYAREHGLLKTAGWRRFKKVAKLRDELTKRQVKQAKL